MGIVVEPLSNCGGCRRSVAPSKARTIVAGDMTLYSAHALSEGVGRSVPRHEGDQAALRRKSALDYLIGEKLISFAEAARDRPAFARELPKFLAAIWHTFNLPRTQRGGGTALHREPMSLL